MISGSVNIPAEKRYVLVDVAENHKSWWYPHLRFPAAQGRLALTFEHISATEIILKTRIATETAI